MCIVLHFEFLGLFSHFSLANRRAQTKSLIVIHLSGSSGPCVAVKVLARQMLLSIHQRGRKLKHHDLHSFCVSLPKLFRLAERLSPFLTSPAKSVAS